VSEAWWDPSSITFWSGQALVVVALLGAWLSLDETALGQTWLAQPLPAATMTAWLLGDPAVGMLIGLPFQFVTLGNLPVGQTFLGDKASPVVGVVAAAVVTGFLEEALGGELLQTGPGAGRVGWLLILVALGSLASHSLVRLERTWHVHWGTRTLRLLRPGGTRPLDRVQMSSLLVTGMRGAVTSVVMFGLTMLIWQPGYGDLPDRMRLGLGLLPWLTPAIGLGALVELFGSRAGIRWLLSSFLLTLFLFWMVAWKGGAT